MRSVWMVAPLVVLGLLVGAFPAAAQQPAPPPNPSDQELQAGRDAVVAGAGEVGRLSTVVADLDRQAAGVQAELETKRETAFQRLLGLQAAQEAADDAVRRVGTARIESTAAASAIDVAQGRLDEFAVSTYQQTLDLGPLGLLTASTGPEDLVARAELTDLIAREQLRALDAVQRAAVGKVNAESTARAAEEQAQARQEEAERAKVDADGAVAEATSAVAEHEAALRVLDGQRAAVEQRLEAARVVDVGLQGQRERYVDYQRRAAEAEAEARRRAEQVAAADAAARAAAEPPVPDRPPDARLVDVDRGAAQLGPQYECRSKIPRWGPVKPWVSEAGQLLRCRFGVGSVGGVGARPNPSDHPAGLALDFFVDRTTGDALADCAVRNRDRLAVKYVIFRQRINTGSGWQQMQDRGSAVANHMEHVHISFRSASGGSLGAVRC